MGFLFVDDGSSDGTVSLLERWRSCFPKQFFILRLEHNVGKGEAVRQGILRLNSHPGCVITGYWDADLSTPLADILKFRCVMRENAGVCLVSGCRSIQRGTRLKRLFFRSFLGKLASSLIRLKLRIPIQDAQCGAKLFTLHPIGKYFHEPFQTRWLFDAELFLRILRSETTTQQKKILREVPVTSWSDAPGSKLNLFQAGMQLLHFLFL